MSDLSLPFSSVAQSCPTLCDPMDCRTPDFPVHHQLLELAQTHVHQVNDAIQPSHPLLAFSPLAFSLSQHQGLSIESVLPIRWPKYWSFSFRIRPDFIWDWLVWSPCNPADSQESSLTPLFKSINSSVLSFLYGSTWLYLWLCGSLLAKYCRCFLIH